MTDAPILVLGSTGKTGRRIVQKLQTLGHTVREGSRRSPIPFDWEDRSTWRPALEGVRSVYAAYFPDLAAPKAKEDIRVLCELAADASVERLVLLSGRGEDAAQECEQIALASEVGQTTIVRAAWFMQNFDEGAFAPLVQRGSITLPVPAEASEPFVDAEDIADVAVAALTEDGHAGRIYELTGPRLVDWSEVASELSKATGRDIAFEQVPAKVFRTELAAEAGEDFAALVTELCEMLSDGRNASLADGVQQALGRPARDFGTYARETAATGVWNVEGVRA